MIFGPFCYSFFLVWSWHLDKCNNQFGRNSTRSKLIFMFDLEKGAKKASIRIKTYLPAFETVMRLQVNVWPPTYVAASETSFFSLSFTRSLHEQSKHRSLFWRLLKLSNGTTLWHSSRALPSGLEREEETKKLGYLVCRTALPCSFSLDIAEPGEKIGESWWKLVCSPSLKVVIWACALGLA